MTKLLIAALRRLRHSPIHLKWLVRRRLAAGKIDKALGVFPLVIEQMQLDPKTAGRAVGCRTADKLCLEIGRHVLRHTGAADPTPRPKGELPDVYIASEIYPAGGHTAVIGDFVTASRRRRAWLLLTDYRNCGIEPQAATLFRTKIGNRRVRVAPHGSQSAKLRWLITMLQELAPERVFLFQHPDDAVAVAAAQQQLAGQVYLVHHVDFMPCIGSASSDFTHIDVTPFRLSTCSRRLAPRKPLFLPLCVDDRPLPQRPTCDPPLRTATSGHAGKFALTGRYHYPDVIARLIEATGITHFHIGPLSDEYKHDIRRRFSRPSMFERHFRHVPHVSSLMQAMDDLQVHVYINSFPHRGARASVEVMCSGTPAIWHAQDASWFHDTHMKYDQAAVWRHPQELIRLIQRATPPWLAVQAEAARRWYETHHHPSILARCLGDTEVRSWQPPARAA